MSEILVKEYSEITGERADEAAKLHAQIMANGQLAASALLEFCKGLKRMKDEKLYTELGFDTFEDYTEKLAGIKSRMAYHYISCYENLGTTFLRSNASLGITKLTVLSKLSPVERYELAESGEAESLSVRELEEKVKELTSAKEQLSFLNTETKEKAEETEKNLKEQLEKALKEAESLKAQLEATESDNEITDEEREYIRAEAEREVHIKHCTEISNLKSKSETEIALLRQKLNEAEERAQKVKEETMAQAEKAAKEQISAEYEERFAALSGESEKYKTELEKLRKEQQLEADGRTAEFQFRFKNLQSEIKACLSLTEEIAAEDKEKAEKLRAALEKYFMIILSNIERK